MRLARALAEGFTIGAKSPPRTAPRRGAPSGFLPPPPSSISCRTDQLATALRRSGLSALAGRARAMLCSARISARGAADARCCSGRGMGERAAFLFSSAISPAAGAIGARVPQARVALTSRVGSWGNCPIRLRRKPSPARRSTGSKQTARRAAPPRMVAQSPPTCAPPRHRAAPRPASGGGATYDVLSNQSASDPLAARRRSRLDMPSNLAPRTSGGSRLTLAARHLHPYPATSLPPTSPPSSASTVLAPLGRPLAPSRGRGRLRSAHARFAWPI